MLVSLTDSSPHSPLTPPPVDLVGGKAWSLSKLYSTPGLKGHVPKAFALTVDFFRPWVESIASTEEWRDARGMIGKDGARSAAASSPATAAICTRLKEMCHTMSLNQDQRDALDELRTEMKSWPGIGTACDSGNGGCLAAVRSSAPEEDGSGASFAGAFETKLGVPPADLEGAVRACFASMFDYRVFSYTSARTDKSGGGGQAAFAAVVMQMVDSSIAGVAFSANPLNSDRDEMVVDSSYGLGESVVDGSIAADRYVFCKVSLTILEKTVGKKTQEKRLSKDSEGGVEIRPVEKEQQLQSSLTIKQVKQLAKLVCLVESTYNVPMDIEFAYTGAPSGEGLELKLLQARPVTALFKLDDDMMTSPGEKRILYYDFNIASEATTTTPFTHMDMTLYTRMSNIMLGITSTEFTMLPYDPRMPIFNASTRQYCNLSIFFKFVTPEYCSKMAQLLDPYLAGIFASKDCDRKKYRCKKLPKGVNIRNAWWIMRQLPLWKLYKIGSKFKSNPEKAKLAYLQMLKLDMDKVKQLEERGMDKAEGLQQYAEDLYGALTPSLFEELGCIMVAILPLFNELDKKRREGKTDQVRSEYDALCGGYEGDELMDTNIEIHRLANKLPESIWLEYEHEELLELAGRIKSNLDGDVSDIPSEFLDEWKHFICRFGFDGQDQLFISSPRYVDSPEILLAKLRHNVGAAIKDPAVTQQEQVAKRREIMKLHEARAKEAKCLHPFASSKIRKRNAILDHTMWMRNAPKLHFARIFGIIRAAVLQVQDDLIDSKRLEKKGDIFHLDLVEVDQALQDDSCDLIEIIRPRKAAYERATRATECPMLIDSRCRILKPDPPALQGEQEEGTLIGAAVSPGVATGRIRIIYNPSERFETGEVLATVVTGPAWTPLFVGASAVILQIGGVLQHGALCAREYGKPAVSNIDVHAHLKTGMMVSVDGNTGIVKILEEE